MYFYQENLKTNKGKLMFNIFNSIATIIPAVILIIFALIFIKNLFYKEDEPSTIEYENLNISQKRKTNRSIKKINEKTVKTIAIVLEEEFAPNDTETIQKKNITKKPKTSKIPSSTMLKRKKTREENKEKTIFFWEEKIIKEGHKKEFEKIFKNIKTDELKKGFYGKSGVMDGILSRFLKGVRKMNLDEIKEINMDNFLAELKRLSK
jgi:hypothetical protein